MMKISVIALLAFGLSGCASTITAIKNRPMAAHKTETRLWTSTGERRFVAWIALPDGKFLLCPEPTPFTGQAVTSSSKPNFKPSEVISLSSEEAYGTNLVTVGTLTENLAALDRNFANSCNLNMAGYLGNAEFIEQVKADNAVRRLYVLASAGAKTSDKELQAKIDAAVKDAVAKAVAEKGWQVTVAAQPTSPKAVTTLTQK
ncbi:hypothetical protein [Sphingobium sp. HWE2-09]|uniref:hypothetical protein n=1 Tax=Sphingobium sp. HWE2-09 TaxID=3108390 RepID=UPI002DC7C7D7|nr:hypothetical protein [Sphingobium sp. HWE2-09]